jgi:hypothetical protein
MISFICFCVFSYSLFLVSWSFLSAFGTFRLTMSSYHLHETLSAYLQDFFFEVVLVDIVGFLGVIYLCFLGIWNWVSVFFISL